MGGPRPTPKNATRRNVGKTAPTAEPGRLRVGPSGSPVGRNVRPALCLPTRTQWICKCPSVVSSGPRTGLLVAHTASGLQANDASQGTYRSVGFDRSRVGNIMEEEKRTASFVYLHCIRMKF